MSLLPLFATAARKALPIIGRAFLVAVAAILFLGWLFIDTTKLDTIIGG